jgi:transcriptional regulator with XRE-family HTH domain
MLAKGWTGAELAREASKFAPKGVEIGRHLVSAYSRGANEPTDVNLGYIAKALGMKPDELLPPMPGEGESPQYATATSGLDGKTRLVVDAEVDSETALKILAMVRNSVAKGKAA